MNCSKCKCVIDNYEHYVELKDGSVLDETCFFDMALSELGAKSKQHGFEEYEQEDNDTVEVLPKEGK